MFQTVQAQRPEEPAKKMLEIGVSNDKGLSRSFFGVLKTIDTEPTRYDWNSYSPKYRLVIVNYGTDKRIVHREKLLLQELEKFRLPHTMMTVVRGGTCKSEQTIFWQVPVGTDVPKICETDK